MASLGQELKNLRTELKEHRINALEGNERPVDPNQKGGLKATKFCGFCRTNGHTPNFCRKKKRRCGMKKTRSYRMKLQPRKRLPSPKITTRDEDPPTDPGIELVGTMVMGLWCQPHDNSPEEIFGQIIRILTTSDKKRPFERGAYTNNNNDRYNDYRARSPYQPNQDQSRNWGSNKNYSRSPSTSRQDSSFTDFRGQPGSNSPNPSVFNRFGNRDSNNKKSYEKNSQVLTTVTSPTWFELLHREMKFTDYRDYAL